jgi:hypothetical protein
MAVDNISLIGNTVGGKKNLRMKLNNLITPLNHTLNLISFVSVMINLKTTDFFLLSF